MKNFTLDAETAYDPANKYSLSCMSTEDYIADERFEEILWSVQADDEPAYFFTGDAKETHEQLLSLELHKHAITAHHARFDVSILAMRHEIYPKHIFCTEYMANPLKPMLKSCGLAALARFFGLGEKGDEVINAMGKRRLDFSADELHRYGTYGLNDIFLARGIFKRLRPFYSNDELLVLDMIIRMYTQPQLEGDLEALRLGLKNAQQRKVDMISQLEVQGITKKMLGSGPQFAQLLRDRGIEPPMKVSPGWLKKPEEQRDPAKMMAYAFGKTDPEFLQLKEDMAADEEVTALLNARTETKSTIEEDRCTRYIKKVERHRVFRCPVVYASTHTQRLGGDEQENVLNAPNVDKQKDGTFKSYLRFGFAAPKGHTVVAIDYSQIEARISAVTVGQADVVQGFRDGRDQYSEFAEKHTGRPCNKALAAVDQQADKDRKLGKETILGGWFGLGGVTFQRRARGKGLRLTLEEAKGAIASFREQCHMAPVRWAEYDGAIAHVFQYREPARAGDAEFLWDEEHENTLAIRLLNGTKLYYPNIRMVRDERGRVKYKFQRARDKWLQNLWGGVVMNNWAQANAGILIRRAMVDVYRELRVRPALQVYDEILWVVPASDAEAFKKEASAIMVRDWDLMPSLPLAIEAKTGTSYGHV